MDGELEGPPGGDESERDSEDEDGREIDYDDEDSEESDAERRKEEGREFDDDGEEGDGAVEADDE